MRLRPRQMLDADHDERIALADPLQNMGQNWPGAIAAGSLLFMDFGAARGLQGLRLGQGGLIFG